MSVQRYETADGTRWRVRWREPSGGMRSTTVPSKRDAVALDSDIRARKFRGDALPRRSRDTLADAYDEWLRLRAPTLAPQTQQVYRYAWNTHVRNRGFDAHRLSDLVTDPMLLEELTADMRERGVGPAAQRKALVVLSAVLTAAVQWKKIPTNPVWRMPKPPATRQRHPHPFPPLLVERIRLRVSRRETKSGPYRAMGDACLVSLLSYAGLRPGEALALTWGDIGRRTLAIDKAVADGVIGSTKTGAARSVPLVEPLRQDLDLWKAFTPRTSDDRLVLPGHDDRPWSRTQANNWRGRVWRPTLEGLAAETKIERLATAIPYDCRGSFVSLHLRAGASPLEVAAWAGHSPPVMFRHYANVIEELVGEPPLPAEEQITRARVAVQERSSAELDRFVVDLFENPTTSSPGSSRASCILYAPWERQQ